jgi:hypothetical protein
MCLHRVERARTRASIVGGITSAARRSPSTGGAGLELFINGNKFRFPQAKSDDIADVMVPIGWVSTGHAGALPWSMPWYGVILKT